MYFRKIAPLWCNDSESVHLIQLLNLYKKIKPFSMTFHVQITSGNCS